VHSAKLVGQTFANALSGASALAAVLSLGGCQKVPFGEVLIVVDTDVSVPKLVSRLRVDVYGSDQTWLASRDVSALDPGDWPVSFSLSTDQPGEVVATVRLRAYREGAVRDYRGAQPAGHPPFAEPSFPGSPEALCQDVPLLAEGEEVTLRRGPTPIAEHAKTAACPFATLTGSIALRVEIPAHDDYRFEVVRSVPNGAIGQPDGDTTLFLRRTCDDPDTDLACNDNIIEPNVDLLSRITATLDAGEYFLITGGGQELAPADLTLRWARASDWDVRGANDGGSPSTPDGASSGPRLIIAGTDVTPLTEPEPGLTIDRMARVRVRYGQRATGRFRLSGECLGTDPDVLSGRTCVDLAGARVPISDTSLTSGISRGEPTVAGTWAGERNVDCTAAPRPRSQGADGRDLYDEEVCVPGGAFILGAADLVGLGDADGVPRQVAVVDPFLMDRYEVTVGRFRDAQRRGFIVPDPLALVVNDRPLFAVTGRVGPCTYNGDVSGPAPGIDREDLPLNCMGWYNARALCQFLGGDLPTHVQWEYAATTAGDPPASPKRPYPWGEAAPTCTTVLYGNSPGHDCYGPAEVEGPAPVAAPPWADHDVTPLGIVGMGGNVSEWTLDSMRPYRDPCWWQRPLRQVACWEEAAPERSIRGANWGVSATAIRAELISAREPAFPQGDQGVRCARHGTAP
jgi:formylglycine-generating enzyme required for sulfatase activity